MSEFFISGPLQRCWKGCLNTSKHTCTWHTQLGNTECFSADQSNAVYLLKPCKRAFYYSLSLSLSFCVCIYTPVWGSEHHMCVSISIFCWKCPSLFLFCFTVLVNKSNQVATKLQRTRLSTSLPLGSFLRYLLCCCESFWS